MKTCDYQKEIVMKKQNIWEAEMLWTKGTYLQLCDEEPTIGGKTLEEVGRLKFELN